MPKFPEHLKGAATARSNMTARTGKTGPKPKPVTLPKMPWDDEKEKEDDTNTTNK